VATRRLAFIAVLILAASAAAGTAQTANPRLLVFTKTTGYRHESIPAAIQAVRELGARNGFDVTATEDASTFTAGGLAPYDAVMFALTTADVLDNAQQTAFEAYIRGGHGYVGIHSASDTERDWPWYGRLVGAYSSGHPEIQPATIDAVAPREPSTAALPARWNRTDEWYGFLTNPRANGVRVLLTLDESTYLPRDWAMAGDHPIAWQHEFDGGRAWYTAGGHTTESYSEALFLGHLLGGIQYALAKPLGTGTASTAAAAGQKLAAPKLQALSVIARRGRAVVSVRPTGCASCTGKLVVRSKAAKLRLAGGLATGTSAVLPAGRWQVTITLTDGKTGLSASAKRWVRIPKP
jgi:type 1 glutamine amidotransferase